MPIRVFPLGFGRNKPRVSGATWKKMVARRRRGVARAMGAKSARGTFAKRVMSVMRRSEETKYVANFPSDGAGGSLGALWYSPGQLTTINDFYPAIPALGQGDDDYERVGNKISPTSLAVSVRVGFNPQDTKAQSLLGVIYYGTDRAGKTWNNVHPLQTASILDNGDGNNSVFNGQRQDLIKPTDKKLVTLKRIVFRLSKTEGIQNSDLSGASVPAGNYSTSNGLSEKNFLLKFKVPQQVVYATRADTFPQNYAPFWAIGFCHADGSALTADDAELVNVNSKCHMYYKDA